MRILRTLMLLTGVTVLMPSPPDDPLQVGTQQAAAEILAPGLIGSATMAFADVASFCTRQPGVCETAGYVAGKLEAKAKYGVRLIYEWAAASGGVPQAGPASEQADATDPITTGSTMIVLAGATPRESQSTLRIDDLIPVWRKPPPHKKS